MRLGARVGQLWANRPVRTGILILLGLGLVWLIGWLAGRKVGRGAQTTYPKNQTIPRTWVEEQAPGIVATLHDAFDGIGVDPDPKVVALKKLLAVDDAQVVYISNEYNHQYFAGSTNTLLKLIEGEFVGIEALLDEGPKLKSQVLARMRSLNIR